VTSLAPRLHDPHSLEVKPGRARRAGAGPPTAVRIGLDHEPGLGRPPRLGGAPRLLPRRGGRPRRPLAAASPCWRPRPPVVAQRPSPRRGPTPARLSANPGTLARPQNARPMTESASEGRALPAGARDSARSFAANRAPPAPPGPRRRPARGGRERASSSLRGHAVVVAHESWPLLRAAASSLGGSPAGLERTPRRAAPPPPTGRPHRPHELRVGLPVDHPPSRPPAVPPGWPRLAALRPRPPAGDAPSFVRRRPPSPANYLRAFFDVYRPRGLVTAGAAAAARAPRSAAMLDFLLAALLACRSFTGIHGSTWGPARCGRAGSHLVYPGPGPGGRARQQRAVPGRANSFRARRPTGTAGLHGGRRRRLFAASPRAPSPPLARPDA